MNASTSAGRPSARSRSGSVTSWTTSVSLHAMKAKASTPAAIERSLDIVDSSTGKGARPPSSPPGQSPGVEAGSRLLERRAQSDRECAEVRERERVHRIDGRRTCAVKLRTTRQADLGIEAAVTCDREQVPSHEADVPIAGPRDRADVIGYEHFAQLRVARIL